MPEESITGEPTYAEASRYWRGAPGGALVPYVRLDAGSTGTSYSVALPDVATLGAVLLTIPASPTRAFAFVENQSAADLTLVGDKGDGTEIWHRKLTGAGANMQGAEWASNAFLGRVRVYGAAGAQVSAGEF